MSTIERARRREKFRHLTSLLLDDVRRRIVHELHEEDGPIPVTELADRVRETASGPESSSTPRVETLRVELRHRHLPKLVENGLVHWDRETGTVTSGYHPVYNEHSPGDLAPTDSTRSLAAALDSPRRRAILASFRTADERRTRETVAREVASAESVGAPPESLVEEVRTEHHHEHLPKLETAGYVDHDLDDGTVAYRGARSCGQSSGGRTRLGPPGLVPGRRPAPDVAARSIGAHRRCRPARPTRPDRRRHVDGRRIL